MDWVVSKLVPGVVHTEYSLTHTINQQDHLFLPFPSLLSSMTEIKEAKPGSSPTKGTPEGRRLWDLAIQKALEEVQSQKDSKKTNLVWISDEMTDFDILWFAPRHRHYRRVGLAASGSILLYSRSPGTSSLPISPWHGLPVYMILTSFWVEGSDDLDNGVLQKHIAGCRQWPNSSVSYYESPLTASLAALKSSITIPSPSTPTCHSIHSAKIPNHGPKAIPKKPPSPPGPSPQLPDNEENSMHMWSTLVAALQVKNPELVSKGFSDLGKAQAAYKAAKTSGVIDALQKGEGQKFWVVIEGFKPGVYFSGYDALRDGLKWGGGFVTPFAEEMEADEYWNRQVNADRIVDLPDPGYVD
ncbi:hypothetical protein F5876DRAFT_81834 [Lentinula aff. lateritia]|uniref:Uncharacterized protein n=1 Tax=Lentinula aff. lateritia TaxID=2804960 RepID=A0ACC1TKZ9_9AGAR|nr:hypothetical protein F5876DRAFT_81834 [Lentinula aff. lateritia]